MISFGQYVGNPKGGATVTQEIPSKLSDIMGKDLAGWQVRYCHYLELKHHEEMAYYPALFTETKATIFASSKAALRIVYEKLPRKSARVCSDLCLVNEGLKLGFMLETKYGVDKTPFRVYSADELESMSRQPDAFCWASGLRRESPDKSEPDFT